MLGLNFFKTIDQSQQSYCDLKKNNGTTGIVNKLFGKLKWKGKIINLNDFSKRPQYNRGNF